MTQTPTKGKPLIAVCGGLGMQGSSVVKFLLEDDFFSVRILTRNPNSASAKNMALRGVEVVKADFDDTDSLRRAFEGAYGVFGVTNWFDAGDRERQQGFNMVDAAKDTGVQHFVWSSCEHTEYKIPTFETKADVDDYLKASGIPRTSILATFYYSNVFLFGLDRKRPDGTYYMPWIYPTDCPFPAFDVADMGAFVTAAFMDPEEWIDKEMPVCSEYISPRQLHQTFEEITGTEIKTPEVSDEDFEAMKDIPNPYDLWRNMKYFQMHGTTCRDAALSRRIYPRLTNWRQFVIRKFTEPPKRTLEIPMTVDVTFQDHEDINHDSNQTTSTISAY